MPEITVTHIALLALTTIIGLTAGWFLRGSRSSQEKTAISEGWQVQLEARRIEHERLVSQNKSLMEQVNQLQASAKDGSNRARELSDALKEAFARRDQLQRQIKEIRGNLEVAVQERDRLKTDVGDGPVVDETLLRQKEETIDRLNRELSSWQDRLPPLIERFRIRNEEANELEAELATARLRIDDLETMLDADETRVDPVDASALTDALEASNDPEETPPQQDDAGEGLAVPTSEDEPEAEAVSAITNDEPEAKMAAVVEALQPDPATGIDHSDADDTDDAVAGPVAGEQDGARLDNVESIAEPIVQADVETDVETDVEPDVESIVEPIAARVVETAAEPSGGLRDNLRLIKGIGPAIEKTLNELGIFRFHQVAELSHYDIERIAKRLKGFRTRIEREDWLGQARELHDQKSAGLASNQS